MTIVAAFVLPVLFVLDPEAAGRVRVPTVAEETVDGGQAGRDPAAVGASRAEEVVITSERSDFDRTEGLTMFEGNVRVDYKPDYTLVSDRLFVFFRGSNELDRIVASGNVAITNEMRVGRCDTAIFRRAAREIEMRGAPDGTPARLEEVGRNSVDGKSIRFWLETEQVEVNGSTIGVETGKGDLRKL